MRHVSTYLTWLIHILYCVVSYSYRRCDKVNEWDMTSCIRFIHEWVMSHSCMNGSCLIHIIMHEWVMWQQMRIMSYSYTLLHLRADGRVMHEWVMSHSCTNELCHSRWESCLNHILYCILKQMGEPCHMYQRVTVTYVTCLVKHLQGHGWTNDEIE